MTFPKPGALINGSGRKLVPCDAILKRRGVLDVRRGAGESFPKNSSC